MKLSSTTTVLAFTFEKASNSFTEIILNLGDFTETKKKQPRVPKRVEYRIKKCFASHKNLNSPLGPLQTKKRD